MRQLVDQDLPLTPQRFGLRALLKIYQRRGDLRNLTTAKYLRRDSLIFYSMEGSEHLYYGRQLPSTGYVRGFPSGARKPRLRPADQRARANPDRVPEYIPQPKLLNTLREYTALGRKDRDAGHRQPQRIHRQGPHRAN